MPNYSYGSIWKERAKCLLKTLLDYVNGDLPDLELKNLDCRWKGEYSCSPELIVETKLTSLELLTQKGSEAEDLDKRQINQLLSHYLREFLHILSDNRALTKGSDKWHFTLQLWSRDTSENLKQFEREWERKKSNKSKQHEKTFRSSTILVDNSSDANINAPEEQGELDNIIKTLRLKISNNINQRCSMMRILDMTQPIELSGKNGIYTDVNILEKISRDERLKIIELMRRTKINNFGSGNREKT